MNRLELCGGDILVKGEREVETMKKYFLRVKEPFTWAARGGKSFDKDNVIETTDENEVEYLTGLNPLNKVVVDVEKIEEIKEVETEKVTTKKPEVKKAVKKTTKKSK